MILYNFEKEVIHIPLQTTYLPLTNHPPITCANSTASNIQSQPSIPCDTRSTFHTQNFNLYTPPPNRSWQLLEFVVSKNKRF